MNLSKGGRQNGSPKFRKLSGLLKNCKPVRGKYKNNDVIVKPGETSVSADLDRRNEGSIIFRVQGLRLRV